MMLGAVAMAKPSAKKLKEAELPEVAQQTCTEQAKEGWKFKKAEQTKAGNVFLTLTPPKDKEKEMGKEVVYAYNASGGLAYRYWEVKSRNVPKEIYNACENTENDQKIKAACATCPKAPGQLKNVHGYYMMDKIAQWPTMSLMRCHFTQNGKENNWYIQMNGKMGPTVNLLD